MLKKLVVALALFMGITGTQAFARTLPWALPFEPGNRSAEVGANRRSSPEVGRRLEVGIGVRTLPRPRPARFVIRRGR